MFNCTCTMSLRLSWWLEQFLFYRVIRKTLKKGLQKTTCCRTEHSKAAYLSISVTGCAAKNYWKTVVAKVAEEEEEEHWCVLLSTGFYHVEASKNCPSVTACHIRHLLLNEKGPNWNKTLIKLFHRLGAVHK